jgi:hypothetical protein
MEFLEDSTSTIPIDTDITRIAELQSLYRKLQALNAIYRTQKVCVYRPRDWSELGERGKQTAFHEAGAATVRLVLGDNRSGKSVAGVCEAIAHSLGYRPWLPVDHPHRIVRLTNGEPIPVPNIGRVLAQNYNQAIKQNIYPKFQEWAPLGQYKVKYDTRQIPVEIVWDNGSKIYFMSDDQEDDVFEGTAGHWFWCDEPPSYNKYVALMRGIVDFSGHGWLTLTPLSQPWIADVIEARGNDPDNEVRVFEFSIWDNCTDNGGVLSPKAIKSFIGSLREDQKAARIGRQWLHLTGRVFPTWKPEPPYWVAPFDIPAHWPRVELCDPHKRKAIAVMWVALSPANQLIVYRDLFDDELKTVDQVSDRIKKLEGWKPYPGYSEHRDYRRDEDAENVVLRLMDWAAREEDRTSGQSIWSRFAENKLLHLLANKRNADAGYDAIHDALRIEREWDKPGIVVFNTCQHVKQNFLRIVWDDWATSKMRDTRDAKPAVRKMNDDFIDLLRYCFQSGLTYRLLVREMRRQTFSDTPVKSTAVWRTA